MQSFYTGAAAVHKAESWYEGGGAGHGLEVPVAAKAQGTDAPVGGGPDGRKLQWLDSTLPGSHNAQSRQQGAANNERAVTRSVSQPPPWSSSSSFYSEGRWQTRSALPPIFIAGGRRPDPVTAMDRRLRAAESIGELVSVLSQGVRHFDPGNAVIALSCGAKLVDDRSLGALQAYHEWDSLLGVVLSVAGMLEPRGLSMVANCAAKVGWKDQRLFRQLATTAARKAQAFGATDIAKICWGFAKCDHVEGFEEFWAAMESMVEQKVHQGKFIDVSMIAWAFGQAERGSEVMYAEIARAALSMQAELPPQSLSNLACAFARGAGADNAELFAALTTRAAEVLHSFTEYDVASFSWALARVGRAEPELLNRIANHAVAAGLVKRFTSQMASQLAWALATARLAHTVLFEQLAGFIASHAAVFDTQHLANCAWAFASADSQQLPMVLHAIAAAVKGGRLWNFSAEELSALFWAFARGRRCWVDEELFRDMVQVALQRFEEFDSQSLVNVLSSIITLGRETVVPGGASGKFLPPLPESYPLQHVCDCSIRALRAGHVWPSATAAAARALCQAGRLQDALTLLDVQPPSGNSESSQLGLIAVLLEAAERQGNMACAASLWERLAADASRVTDAAAPALRSACLNCAAGALAEAGCHADSESLLKRLADEGLFSSASERLAQRLGLAVPAAAGAATHRFMLNSSEGSHGRNNSAHSGSKNTLAHQECEGLLAALLSNATPGDASSVLCALADCKVETEMLGVMSSSRVAVLDEVIGQRRPRTVLDIRGGVGFAALRAATQVQDLGVQVLLVESDPFFLAAARSMIELAGATHAVRCFIGQLDECLPLAAQSRQTADLVLLHGGSDAQYVADLEQAEELGLLSHDCMVLADHILTPGAPRFLWHMQTTANCHIELVEVEEPCSNHVLDWMAICSTAKGATVGGRCGGVCGGNARRSSPPLELPLLTAECHRAWQQLQKQPWDLEAATKHRLQHQIHTFVSQLGLAMRPTVMAAESTTFSRPRAGQPHQHQERTEENSPTGTEAQVAAWTGASFAPSTRATDCSASQWQQPASQTFPPAAEATVLGNGHHQPTGQSAKPHGQTVYPGWRSQLIDTEESGDVCESHETRKIEVTHTEESGDVGEPCERKKIEDLRTLSFDAWLAAICPEGRAGKYLQSVQESYDTVAQIVKTYVVISEDGGGAHLDPRFFKDLGVTAADSDIFLKWFVGACGVTGGDETQDKEVGGMADDAGKDNVEMKPTTEPDQTMSCQRATDETRPPHQNQAPVAETSASIDVAPSINLRILTFRDWLTMVAPDGSLLVYHEQLAESFDTVSQIVKSYSFSPNANEEVPSSSTSLDPQFFEDLGITNDEHKHAFENWFAAECTTGEDSLPHVSAYPVTTSEVATAAVAAGKNGEQEVALSVDSLQASLLQQSWQDQAIDSAEAQTIGADVKSCHDGADANLNLQCSGFKDWLVTVSPSGELSKYEASLEDSYDTLSQVIKAYTLVSDKGKHFNVQFFTDIGVDSVEHQELFKQWFKKAEAATVATAEKDASQDIVPPTAASTLIPAAASSENGLFDFDALEDAQGVSGEGGLPVPTEPINGNSVLILSTEEHVATRNDADAAAVEKDISPEPVPEAASCSGVVDGHSGNDVMMKAEGDSTNSCNEADVATNEHGRLEFPVEATSDAAILVPEDGMFDFDALEDREHARVALDDDPPATAASGLPEFATSEATIATTVAATSSQQQERVEESSEPIVDGVAGAPENSATAAHLRAATCPNSTDVPACAVSPAALVEVPCKKMHDESALQCSPRVTAINKVVGATYKAAQRAVYDVEVAAATSKAAAWRQCETLWTVASAVGEAAGAHWDGENAVELQAAIHTASFALDQAEFATGSAKPAAWAVCDVHWAAAMNTTMFSGAATDKGAVDTVQQDEAEVMKAVQAVDAVEEFQAMKAVHVYHGFTEHTYRLVFLYEDKFAPDTPHLLTIVPSGVVENSKVLEPQKEKGLIAYAYPQSVSDDITGLAAGQQPCSNGDSSTAGDGNNKLLRDTAFVWRRQDGTNALVQTWPTTLNEKFLQDFEITEGANPDSTKFQPQAVSEFQEAMVRLFGPTAASYPILFCHKKLVSTSPAVVGLGEEVLAHLKEHPNLMRELAIASIDSEGLGFVADGTNGKGQKFEKHFRLTPGEQCVVYRKTGWSTMGCIKPLNQFLREAEFHEPPKLEDPVGVEYNVAAAAMAVETTEVAEAADGESGSKQAADGEAAMVTEAAETTEVTEFEDIGSKQTGDDKVAVPAVSTATASRAAKTLAGFFDFDELDG